MSKPSRKIFLSYNRQNQPIVEVVSQKLQFVGFDVSITLFFDKENLKPSDQWLDEIEKALDQSNVCIIFIGPQGLGAWQSKEVLKAVDKCISTNGTYRIIPVILPDENNKLDKNLPWFLADYQWVELSDAADETSLIQLVEGITKNEEDQIISEFTGNPYKGLDYFDVKDAPFFLVVPWISIGFFIRSYD